MGRKFARLPTGDGYALDVHDALTEIRVERLRRERGELVGELTVLSALPGAKTTDGILHVADFNMSSARARVERAGIIEKRLNLNGPAESFDTFGALEEFCQRVLSAERIGEPAVLLRTIAKPTPDEDVQIDHGVKLLRRHPVILFGDGGDAKSYLALYFAASLSRAGWRVLYVDWEFAGEDHRERLEKICGPDMPELWYVRAERPLVHEADRLVRIIADQRIDYVICDSIAFACDGPPEAAEVAGSYFRALRKLGIGSLHVAHISKAENADQKPFGSAFWHNGARSTWYIKRSAGSLDDDHVSIGLFHRKVTIGRRLPAVGYQIDFDEDRTSFRRIDLTDVADLATRLPVNQRMRSLLSAGSMTMAQIAVELDVPVDTIVKAAKRGDGRWFTRLPGADGVFRIGLLAEAS